MNSAIVSTAAVRRAFLLAAAASAAIAAGAAAQTVEPLLPTVPLHDADCNFDVTPITLEVPPCVVDGTRSVTNNGRTRTVRNATTDFLTDNYSVTFNGNLKVDGQPVVTGPGPVYPFGNTSGPGFGPVEASYFFGTDGQTVNVSASYTGEKIQVVSTGASGSAAAANPAYWSRVTNLTGTVNSIAIDLDSYFETSDGGEFDFQLASLDPANVVNNATALSGRFHGNAGNGAIQFGTLSGTATVAQGYGTTPYPGETGAANTGLLSLYKLGYDVAATVTTSLDETGLITPKVTVSQGIEMNGSTITGLAAGTAASDAVNKAQLDAAIAGVSGGGTASPYMAVNSTGDAASATGTEAIAVGSAANALGTDALAIGRSSLANSDGSIAVGGDGGDEDALGARATQLNSTALGADALATGAYASALGSDAQAAGDFATAAGFASRAAASGTGLGVAAQATGVASTALGSNALANGSSGLAAGAGAQANGDHALALGSTANAMAATAIAVGHQSAAGGNSVAVGVIATATNGGTAVGQQAIADGQSSAAFGGGANARGSQAVAIGTGAQASNQSSTAVGSSARATAGLATAVGTNAQASGYASSATGTDSVASGFQGMASGVFARAIGDYSMAFGRATFAAGEQAMAMGPLASAGGNNATAVGGQARAAAAGATALGAAARANHASSTAVGTGAVTTAANQLVLGNSQTAVVVAGIDASTNAQQGPVDVVTVDANGTLGRQRVASAQEVQAVSTQMEYIAAVTDSQFSALSNQVSDLSFRLDDLSRSTSGGIAAAMALGGTIIVPDSTVSVSVNGSTYRGQQGFSGVVAARVSEKVYVTGGIAGSTANKSTGGRVGMAVGF